MNETNEVMQSRDLWFKGTQSRDLRKSELLFFQQLYFWKAAIENIVAACICGIVYALFAGQPLSILSETGPILIFEMIIYNYCG